MVKPCIPEIVHQVLSGSFLIPSPDSSEDKIFQAECNDKEKYPYQCYGKRIIPHDRSYVISCGALDEPEVGISHIGYDT